MDKGLGRREFLRAAAGGVCALCAGCARSGPRETPGPVLASPGCWSSKVKVAKVYLGIPKGAWPTPLLDLDEEVRRYEAEFARMGKVFADVDFTVNTLVTRKGQIEGLKEAIQGADGVLAIHLSMGITEILKELLAFRKPTMLFAVPFSGHEWTRFGAIRGDKGGELLECVLTSDLDELAVAVRPFRAIHHLREGKILNLTTRALSPDYLKAVDERFGTKIQVIDLPRMMAAYQAVDPDAAGKEADAWIKGAMEVLEPDRDEIVRSCRLALAFERVVAEEKATALTVDCYGSMYRKLPAFPCVGFVRLNDAGLGGICESDLACALTHLILQGLSGRPGFISDPTMDESTRSLYLAHCLGSRRMDGPDGPAAPYRLRSIMERQEGCVPQVRMRVGQRVTQAILVGTDQMQYFTGRIVDAPFFNRGCRTKINVRIDGDPVKLWRNWSHGLHRVTCYGDLVRDLERFCRFQGLKLVNEAV